MYETKGFQNTDLEKLVRDVNNFLSDIKDGELIDIKYSPVSLPLTTHTEFGVYPDSNYTALVIYQRE